MRRRPTRGAAFLENRRSQLRPFPSLLLVVRAAGLVIADPRSDEVVAVTIDDLEALLLLGAASDGGAVAARPDQDVIDRLSALDLLVDGDDPARAPVLATTEPGVRTNDTIELESARVITPSVIRLHEGRPLAWDRHGGVYRELRAAHLRALADMVDPTSDGGDRPGAVELTELHSVGLVETFEPETDPGRPG